MSTNTLEKAIFNVAPQFGLHDPIDLETVSWIVLSTTFYNPEDRTPELTDTAEQVFKIPREEALRFAYAVEKQLQSTR